MQNLSLKLFKYSNYVQGIYLKSSNRLRFCSIITSQKCWNCGTSHTGIHFELICPKCTVIQPPKDNINYFDLFRIEKKFDVDEVALTTKYRSLQSILHPDKFASRSEEEKDISLNYSALLNVAYNTLQKPLQRAIYILKLYGEEINEHDKNTEPELLMEIMELNEEVEAAQSPTEVKQLHKKNKEKLDEVIQRLSECFKENNLKLAKELVIQMKFYNSIRERVTSIMREKGIE